MTTKCRACPLRRKDVFDPFTSDELQFMERFKVGELQVDPGTPLLMQGSNSPQLFTVLRGMGVRHVTTSEGRRQVINFLFPGDFIGLQALVMGEMGHSVDATTRMTLCVFDRSEFWNLFKSHPQRAYDVTWLAAVEEQFLGEALATMGQKAARERIAWAFVKIFERALALDLVRNEGAIPFPFRQQDLADALGLSLVHTNKTLAQLRERQLVTWEDGTIRIANLEALATFAGIAPEEPSRRPLM